MNRITLTGCAPDTLIHYLKAIGLLRLVGEQLDARVRGAWRGSAFVIETERTKDDLLDFFLNKYRPTPIVAPWNNGSGFHTSGKGKKGTTLPAIKNSTTPRLKLYRETIAEAEKLLASCMTPEVAALESTKRSEALKPVLIPACRNGLPDDAIRWIDAVAIIGDEHSTLLPPILGSGGNDGNLDFSLTFMGRLAEVIALDESQNTSVSERQLRASLFGGEAAGVIFSPGHFHPAGVGGVNATTGLEAAFLANPWDYVLAVEGVLMFANAVTRRLGSETNAGASFPFTARMTAAGFGTATMNDDARHEMWLPLWSRMTNIEELKFIFSEGRAHFSGKGRERGELAKNVRSGLDFARAVVELGVDRGIDGFQRYGFIKRIGKMHLATSLGHFEIPRSKDANTYAALIAEVDGWLERVRKAESPPPRLAQARRSVEEAIFDLCAGGKREHLAEILLALGQVQYELARSKKYHDIKDKKYIPPLGSMSVAWADECDDSSTEYRIACALASIVERNGLAPLRVNLEPVTFDKRFDWSQNDVRVVWGAGALAQNLTLVLRRRWVDARREGLWGEEQRRGGGEGKDAPSITHASRAMGAKRFVQLEDIAKFIDGDVDESRIEKLLRALMLVNWRGAKRRLLTGSDGSQSFQPDIRRSWAGLHSGYSLLKLLFLSDDVFKRAPNEAQAAAQGRKPREDFFKPYSSTFAGAIRHEPSLVPLLLTNHREQINSAFRRAAQRLKISGFTPFTDDFYLDERQDERLAAALLIPLSYIETDALCQAVLRPTEKDSTTKENGEEQP
jgi:CRISPR-associated protein Csx17